MSDERLLEPLLLETGTLGPGVRIGSIVLDSVPSNL